GSPVELPRPRGAPRREAPLAERDLDALDRVARHREDAMAARRRLLPGGPHRRAHAEDEQRTERDQEREDDRPPQPPYPRRRRSPTSAAPRRSTAAGSTTTPARKIARACGAVTTSGDSGRITSGTFLPRVPASASSPPVHATAFSTKSRLPRRSRYASLAKS